MDEASAWVRRFGGLVRPDGRVLDVASGDGRNAQWFAHRGHPVLCVDRDGGALARAASVPGVEARQLDLESRPGILLTEFDPASMDAVIVCNYLHRPLCEDLLALLCDGGVLIYETFAAGNERLGRPQRPEFLLRPDELLGLANGMRIVAFEQGRTGEGEGARVRQRLAAVLGDRPLVDLALDARP